MFPIKIIIKKSTFLRGAFFILLSLFATNIQALDRQEIQFQLKQWQDQLSNGKLDPKLASERLHQQLNPLWRRIVDEKLAQRGQSLTQDSPLLYLISETRAQYIGYLYQHGHSQRPPNYLQDIKRELIYIPIRWQSFFYIKVSDYKNKTNRGFEAAGELAKDFLALLFLLLVPYLTWRGINSFTDWLDRYKEELALNTLRGSGQNSALWIQRLNPFIPWFFAYLAVLLAELSLQGTSLIELTLFTPYLKFFFLYKMFRRLIVVVLTQITSIGDVSLSRESRVKINQTARFFAIFTLVCTIILFTLKNMVGMGLVYHLVIQGLKILALFFLFNLAHRWRTENTKLLQRLTHKDHHQRLANLNQSKISFIYALPLLIVSLALMLITTLKSWAGEFDFTKKIAIRFFRRKLESVQTLQDSDTEDLPEDYCEQFLPEIPGDSFLMRKFQSTHAEEIQFEIDEWLNRDTDEHSLAIYGESGIGKSCLLRLIETNNPELDIITTQIPPRLLNKGQVLRHFGNLLEVDLESSMSNLIEIDKKKKKTLILVDNAHNMFLSQVGGFEGIRAFLELINTQTENIFWCASFNEHAWRYLDNVFGKNHYFRVIKKIPTWCEDEIKALIMGRHKSTGYQLSYEAILQAAKSIDENISSDYVESKFFRLLWEQSGGNPVAAIELWFSALKATGPKLLRVGLPRAIKLKTLADFKDDAHFVYAEIVRHENLSSSEVEAATNLPQGLVRHALKMGLENGLLKKDKQDRYRLTPLMKNMVITGLRKKNFIYGK